jgi:Mor family transcriptional regulator
MNGHLETNLRYGRNGVWAFDCDYCGKHNEFHAISRVKKDKPRFCNMACFKAAGGGAMFVVRARVARSKEVATRNKAMFADWKAGVSSTELRLKYNVGYPLLVRTIARMKALDKHNDL